MRATCSSGCLLTRPGFDELLAARRRQLCGHGQGYTFTSADGQLPKTMTGSGKTVIPSRNVAAAAPLTQPYAPYAIAPGMHQKVGPFSLRHGQSGRRGEDVRYDLPISLTTRIFTR